MLKRPGFHTSEFLVAAVTFAGFLANAAQEWTSTHTAAVFSLPALVFILSRGLAKYEQRGAGTPPAG